MDDLPDEVLVLIFKALASPKYVALCSMVCTRWRDICEDATLWRDRELLSWIEKNKGKFYRGQMTTLARRFERRLGNRDKDHFFDYDWKHLLHDLVEGSSPRSYTLTQFLVMDNQNFAKTFAGKDKITGKDVMICSIEEPLTHDSQVVGTFFESLNRFVLAPPPQSAHLYLPYDWFATLSQDRREQKLHFVYNVHQGSLTDVLLDKISHEHDNSIIWTERIVANWIGQIAKALRFLHSHSIVHRGLDIEHVLVMEEYRSEDDYNNNNNEDKCSVFRLELSGWPLDVLQQEIVLLRCAVGVPYFVAPEILSASGRGTESDMWALAVLAYTL